MQHLYIHDWQSLSPLGSMPEEIHQAYLSPKSYLKNNENGQIGAFLPEGLRLELNELKNQKKAYQRLDYTVLMAMWCAEKIAQRQGLKNPMVNIGSSRGATEVLEEQHRYFLTHNKCQSSASPSTTLGNISSWVGQITGGQGAHFSHSITCSSAAHALLNAAAWLGAGMATEAIVGGSEWPLSPFGIAQMQALGVYAQAQDPYPVRAFDLSKKEGAMALGQAACLFYLKPNAEGAVAKISGMGWGTESISHGSSISPKGLALQQSMRMACKDFITAPDLIISHSPGTYLGDKAEAHAIEVCFGKKICVRNNKWKIGHSFGASAAMSVEMALLMLKHQEVYSLPYMKQSPVPKKIERILVNSVGFGGNAVSLLVKLV